jgi:glycosyltransferase involved in cell wall biosynthesis
MLKEAIEYLHARKEKDARFTYEIIVVDDHSADGTADMVGAIRIEKEIRFREMDYSK